MILPDEADLERLGNGWASDCAALETIFLGDHTLYDGFELITDMNDERAISRFSVEKSLLGLSQGFHHI